MGSFNLNSDIYAMLDALGQRYGVRPSSFMIFHPFDGRSILFDIRCAKEGALVEQESSTLKGQYNSKKRGWDKDTYNDLKRKYKR